MTGRRRYTVLTDLLKRRPGAGRGCAETRASLAVGLGLGVAVVLALIGMVCLPYLLPELAEIEHPGAFAGLLVLTDAAMAEETWFRLGIMTILAWPVAWLLGHSEIRPIVARPADVLAVLAFWLVHLPSLTRFDIPTLTSIALPRQAARWMP